jgi:hypothetical protein
MANGVKDRNGGRGFRFEELFLKFMRSIKVDCKRNDTEDLTEPDFLITIPIDVKTKDSPFYQSAKHVGIEPEKCVTIDTNKIKSYLRSGKNSIIVAYVYYDDLGTKGVYAISALKVKEIAKKNKNRVKTFYDNEKKKRNDRVYISTDEMINITELLPFGLDVIDKYLEG